MGYRKVGYMEQLWHMIKWKITHWKKHKRGGIVKRPKPLSGRKLEREALREYGITRHPGETDEELRARVMARVENEYIGTAVVPLDEYQQFLQEVTQRLAVIFQVPVEVLTGDWKQENDPKQEGDA